MTSKEPSPEFLQERAPIFISAAINLSALLRLTSHLVP